jgi:hypothetical protein
MTSRVTSRVMCRGTQTRGGGAVVNDEPARGGVVDEEPARGGVVDDELRDEQRDVPRHPNARRRRSSQRQAA